VRPRVNLNLTLTRGTQGVLIHARKPRSERISCKGQRSPAAVPLGSGHPSNLPRGFQRFEFQKLFRADFFFSDLGQGLGLLMVKRSPGVNANCPKPRCGPILDSTE